MKPRPWTPPELRRALAARAAGRSAIDIARELGRTRESVLKRMARAAGYAFRCRRWTDADDAALRKSYADGVAVGDIATQLGRTKNAIGLRAMRLLLPHHPGAWRVKDRDTARDDGQAGPP